MPWPQKGTAQSIALTGNAPVIGTGKALGLTDGTAARGLYASAGTLYSATGNLGVNVGTAPDTTGYSITKVLGVSQSGSNSGLIADLSGVSAVTINALRQSFQIQRLYERDARGGTRYIEILRAHFGVTSPDYRLQRPEYLGGGSAPIHINPIVQTSATNGQPSPLGNVAAYATATLHNNGFSKSFTEHGIIIGLLCVRADLAYQQGLNRMWSRRSRFDFYWPSLAHLGEQAILNKEIYAQGTEVDNQVFGYQERYAEYRYYPSMITGKLRSTDPQSLDIWHLAQKFDSLPTLSSQFIEENPPIKRALAVQNEPEFFLDVWFDCKCARPMPVYGVPGLVDHF